MLFFLISVFTLVLLYKFFFQPLPSWESEMAMLFFPWGFSVLSRFFMAWLIRSRTILRNFLHFPMVMSHRKSAGDPEPENVEGEEESSLSDLPDLALECILERLSPAGLCSMAGVCSSLREMSTSDNLWEKHMKQKWGAVIGDAAYRKWQCHIASRKRPTLLDRTRQSRLFGFFSRIPALLWSKESEAIRGDCERRVSLPVDSIMAWYLSLETGKFSFPVQVYNREYGNVGFLLSCYDAEVSYDSSTDTFIARYPPHGQGRATIEENIGWNRLRPPTVDTPAHVLHVSDCLSDLIPDDHVEVQWRRNKGFPYGWWYGVVGHLDSCDGNKFTCRCHISDTIVLEFKQYTRESRWRRAIIDRKDHREIGNEADGFYGGIRKLCNEEEISTWKRLWPANTLE